MTWKMRWGILLTAVLMSASVLGLWSAYRIARMLPGFPDRYSLWSPIVLVIGTAVAASVSVRIVRLNWRQVIAAAILAGAGVLGFASITASAWMPADPFLLLFIPGGVFLLPLFDPAVRKAGPAPSTWMVMLAAVFLSFLIIWSTWLNSPVGGFILLLPIFGIILGLLLSFSTEKNMQDGAWVGGLAVLVPLVLLAILLLRG